MFSKKQKRIYLDHSARTPVDEKVIKSMEPYWGVAYGNPNALHKEAVAARKAIHAARAQCAIAISAHPDEIIFTGNGTEANNIAIQGVIEKSLEDSDGDVHIITSNIEHTSVYEIFESYKHNPRVEATYIPVDEHGVVAVKDVEEAIKGNTVLVSLMFGNNEFGSIQPVADVGKMILQKRKERGEGTPLYFHTDAVQVIPYLECDVRKLHVDLLVMDGQKIYGPQGVGALFIKRDTNIAPILFGDGREKALKPGTENTPLIVGLGRAVELAVTDRERETNRLIEVRDYFFELLEKEIPIARINGDRKNRLPNNVHISLPGFDGEYLVLALDAQGVACTTGSACNESKKNKDKRALKALPLTDEERIGSLRFSLGKSTTKAEVSKVVQVLKSLVESQNN